MNKFTLGIERQKKKSHAFVCIGFHDEKELDRICEKTIFLSLIDKRTHTHEDISKSIWENKGCNEIPHTHTIYKKPKTKKKNTHVFNSIYCSMDKIHNSSDSCPSFSAFENNYYANDRTVLVQLAMNNCRMWTFDWLCTVLSCLQNTTVSNTANSSLMSTLNNLYLLNKYVVDLNDVYCLEYDEDWFYLFHCRSRTLNRKD